MADQQEYGPGGPLGAVPPGRIAGLIRTRSSAADGPGAPDGMRLGTAACRAVLEELSGQPVILQLPGRGDLLLPVLESATSRVPGGEWAVIMAPGPDLVTVRAQLGRNSGGLYDLAVLRPGAAKLTEYLAVEYPAGKTLITGPGYRAELRAAVEKALAAVAGALRGKRGRP